MARSPTWVEVPTIGLVRLELFTHASFTSIALFPL